MSRNASVSWMRDGSVLQLSTSADLTGECMSLAGCDNGFSAHPALLRRPSGTTGDSYTTRTTGSSGSSSGGSVGEDSGGGGWWAAAWATGRGWQGNQIPQDSVYDIPRGTPCSPAHGRVINRSSSSRMLESLSVSKQESKSMYGPHDNITYGTNHNPQCCPVRKFQSFENKCIDNRDSKTPTNPEFDLAPSFSGTFSSTNVTNNPMENYDVPRPLAETFYDTPRKFFGGPAPVHAVPGATCSSVLGWAGSLVCGRPSNEQVSEIVKVNGEGRMPVVDATTGVLLQQPLQIQHQHVQGDLYAVINKGKADNANTGTGTTGKPRALSPQRPDIQIQSNQKKVSEHNYVNVTPQVGSGKQTSDISVYCHNCHGVVSSTKEDSNRKNESAAPSFEQSKHISSCLTNCVVKTSPLQISDECKQSGTEETDTHYIVMKPASETFRHQQSHYICMTSPSLHSMSAKTTKNYHTSSLPRQFSSSRSRHSQFLTNIGLTCSYTHSQISSSSSSHTLCYSNSNNLISPSASGECSRNCRNKITYVPRSGRSLSLARNEYPYVHGKPRSNSADSRIGESEIWLNEPFSPINTPPRSPRRRRRRSGKQVKYGKHSRKDHHLPGEGDSGCDLQEAVLRRSSSAPGKTANRDSASSNDSGVSDSLRSYNAGQPFDCLRAMDQTENQSLRPLDLMLSSPCLHASLPRMRHPVHHLMWHHNTRHLYDQGKSVHKEYIFVLQYWNNIVSFIM